MRFARTHFLAFLSLHIAFFTLSFEEPIFAQQTSTTAQRDPQAIAVISKALDAAGGQAALGAIQDFTATGNVSYSWGGGVQGNATVKCRGPHQFRLDATLSDGVHSWVANNGTSFQRKPDGSKSPLPSQSATPAAATFPFLQLLPVIQDTSFSITYAGLVTHNGVQVHDILVQKTAAGGSDPFGMLGKITGAEIFIDPNALTIQAIKDLAYRMDGSPADYSHETQFSNYQTVNKILVPFTITEFIAGQQTAAIQISQITFNNGLTDSDFE